jgi:ABC-type dipeptide/oligopeptide/nickel transport system permease component
VPYPLRRALLVIPTLLGISFLAFALANLAPGDPAEQVLRRTSDRQPTPREIAEKRLELKLDRPLVTQYVSWAGRAFQGDLGISYATRRPVVSELRNRIPYTLQLTVAAALLALAIAVPAGIVCALHRNKLFDQGARLLSLAGASMPSFWLALNLILLFAVRLSMVPVAGRSGWNSYVLPVLTLAVTPAAVLSRFTRSTMLEILEDDYMRTARAKGLTEWRTVLAHGLRNAMVPLLTSFSISLGHLLAGAVIVETIFVWPGVGKLALDAITERDYPMIQGFVLYAGAAFCAINLLVDLAYGVIDPRIRRANVAAPAPAR